VLARPAFGEAPALAEDVERPLGRDLRPIEPHAERALGVFDPGPGPGAVDVEVDTALLEKAAAAVPITRVEVRQAPLEKGDRLL